MVVANLLVIYHLISNARSCNNQGMTILLSTAFKMSQIVDGEINSKPTYLRSWALRTLRDNNMCSCPQDCDRSHCFDKDFCNNGWLLKNKNCFSSIVTDCGQGEKIDQWLERNAAFKLFNLILKHTFTVLSSEFLQTCTSVVFQQAVACSIILARTNITMVRH